MPNPLSSTPTPPCVSPAKHAAAVRASMRTIARLDALRRDMDRDRDIARQIREATTYGELERLAGVVDRVAFWGAYTHDVEAATAELKRRARLRLGGVL